MAEIQFEGKSLPEIFYNRVLRSPDSSLYFTKRDGQWEETTARQGLDYVFKAVKGLQKLGFQKGDRICIFSENREEWMLTDFASQWLGGATTAIYSTSAYDDIYYILESAKPKVLFVSNSEMMARLQPLRSIKGVEYIVTWDSVDPDQVKSNGIKIISRDEFLSESIDESEAKSLLKEIGPENVAILLYTSGTTGEPKGVQLTQANWVANIHQMSEALPLTELKQTISFLPLSHIYERSIHSVFMNVEIAIWFAESVDKLADNLKEANPDVMIGVPRIFEKIYVKIQEKLRTAPKHKKLLAAFAFAVGKETVPYRLQDQKLPISLAVPQKIADALVFNKIRAVTGGQLRYFISGGAPLSKEIAEFFFQAGITILEGYGTSESMINCVNRPGKIRFGTVGLAFRDTIFKVAEDGELLIKGPQVMKSYYNAPEKTKETMTDDGFYKTGDIGEIDKDGFIRITDRKKELIITAYGKNIAPQPIENALKAEPLIEQVCLIGDQRKYVVALIVPNLELCRSWAESKGINISSRKDCAECKPLREHLQTKIDQINEDLARYEKIKYFDILEDVFSIDGGELTPTLKLKRRVIMDKYQAKIDALYLAEAS